ncbi:hypothetical protein SYNPS1DRAFT_29143 [Syncephalis pseudoplumigaleata]|uniref:RRM domain-containing protein n=1 Tax=Syncephalis pseudoplumigaleata TaxID=1712513 RepID=A0A4P9YYV4_9FUNG|nr:hypothetical protein SYNPS1DRAFT_29143 [Syncephalis pseudoplumigaleata]|eukprot:RKP25115.1 hypothetical protein SYNPS1DRAFT_29143 [Syncephalis pseudoplumigaleata]
MSRATTRIGTSSDEHIIDSSVYIEQLPNSWQTESDLRTRLEGALGADTVQCIELPQNDYGRLRGWCFIQFASSALAQQFMTMAAGEAASTETAADDHTTLCRELKDARMLSL